MYERTRVSLNDWFYLANVDGPLVRRETLALAWNKLEFQHPGNLEFHWFVACEKDWDRRSSVVLGSPDHPETHPLLVLAPAFSLLTNYEVSERVRLDEGYEAGNLTRPSTELVERGCIPDVFGDKALGGHEQDAVHRPSWIHALCPS